MFNQRSKTIVIILLILLSVFLLSGCYLMPREEIVIAPTLIEPPAVTFDTYTVKPGTLENSILVTGSFVTVDHNNIFFTGTQGYISSINFSIGSSVQKGDLLLSLDSENIEYQIKLQELRVEKVHLAFIKVKTSYDAGTGDYFSLRNAEIDLESAKLQLENQKSILAGSKLYAPVSGIVSFIDGNMGPGAYVSPYRIIMVISDPSDLQLQYTGVDALNFQSGMDVKVKYNGGDYEGEVAARFSNNSDDLSDASLNTLRIKVKDLPEGVIRGDTASIKLILEKAENVLFIPKQAIRTISGRKYVRILVNGEKIERDIKIGISTVTRSEVVEGLKEGDQVIMD